MVDCGTVINPNLARVQAEGGIVQGIGMTLYENIQYTEKGQLLNNSFMQYKIPTRMDMGNLHVEFESSYEPTGPFGAKSIGEIVINTPAPALTHAIANATGLWFRELPITSEQIAMGIMENENYQYTARTYVCQYANRTYFLNICLLFFLLYDMIILIVRIIIQIDIDTDLGGLL